MRLFRHLPRTPAAPGFVAAIGAFDGIHLGHRELVHRVQTESARTGLASMVLTFEPLPKEYFSPEAPPARLTNFRERWRLLEQDGPEVLCVLAFNDALRRLGAAEFAGKLQAAGVRQIVIGHDFRAGYRGEATAEWFVAQGSRFGLTVQVVPPVVEADIRVGSGVIRNALAAGDLALAARLLGRAYSMRGRVIGGERLGRQLGYPTANIRLARRQAPMDGIFAIRVRGISDSSAETALAGVASLGTRPMLGGRAPLLEAHVFDFAGDLYGRELEVEFVARLRDELRFDSMDLMVEQMHSDAAEARRILASS